MSIKKEYYIGNIKFSSKKACENYVRNEIKLIGYKNVYKVEDTVQYEFLENVLKNHPEYEIKIGAGINYFVLSSNPLTGKDYQTKIIRIDGSEEVFSWVYCCQFKPRTNLENLTRAMREAIQNDIIAFKNQSHKKCQYCGTENSDFHVDHNFPPFRDLKTKFLNITTIPIPTLFTECPIYYLTKFREEDKDFDIAWKKYHLDNANLQILCAKCNLKKG